MTRNNVLVFLIFISMFFCLVTGGYQDSLTSDQINDINRRFDEIERRDRQQQEELDALRSENIVLRESIVALEKEISRIKGRETQPEDEIKNIGEGGAVAMENQGNDDENSKQTLKKVNEITEDCIPDKPLSHIEDSETSNRRKQNRIRQLNSRSTIAFFATRSMDASHLGDHRIILFDKVVTNVGHGYDNTTGVFRAPVSGLYVLSTTILASHVEAAYHFIANGHIYSNLWSDSHDPYATLSQTMILKLNKGEDVAILTSMSDKYLLGRDYTTFSGFLLASTEDDIVVG